MNVRKGARMVALATMLTTSAAACGDDDDPTGPGGNGLTVTALASALFSPATLNVTVGQTVTWTFGPVDHNVIFNPVTGAPADIAITRNGSVARTFNTVGTFPYVCTLHAGMTGTVNVAAASASPAMAGGE
jgi:plastocyanin